MLARARQRGERGIDRQRRRDIRPRTRAHRRHAGEGRAHQRDTTKNIRPHQRAMRGDGRAEIMPDHRLHMVAPERGEQRHGVADQVDHAELAQIHIIARRPAGGAPIAALIRGDNVKPRFGERHHYLAPGIGEFGESMQQQQAWFPRIARFQHVHPQSVHTLDETRAHASRQQ